MPEIDSMLKEHVDITLGNHVWNKDTIDKGKNITDDNNPFVNPAEWKELLQIKKKNISI